MLAEECKAIAHCLVEEIWNQGNLAVADEIFDENTTTSVCAENSE